jgi:hypothetical protein
MTSVESRPLCSNGRHSISVPAATVEPDRDLQQCVDMRFSLSDRNIGRIKGSIFVSLRVTQFEKPLFPTKL